MHKEFDRNAVLRIVHVFFGQNQRLIAIMIILVHHCYTLVNYSQVESKVEAI